MEWTPLSDYLPSFPSSKNHAAQPPIILLTDKKFTKDPSGVWVWYKNQVLPTIKIKLNPAFFSRKQQQHNQRTDLCVAIQCFAIFSGNSILQADLEGNTVAKCSKDLTAELRSIRLT